MTAACFWIRALAACALLTGVAAAAGAQSVPDDDVPGDSPRLHINERGRPTLQLPFGEVVLRGRAATVVQSPSRDRGTWGPDSAWQTRRVQVEGTLFKKVEFEVSREFGDADEPERDTFANVRFNRAFELRAGQFKMPFGRDALIGGTNLDFVYRSLAGRLIAPGRDLGVMAHGRLKSRRLAYQAGVFHGDGDNARSRQKPIVVSGASIRLMPPASASVHSPFFKLAAARCTAIPACSCATAPRSPARSRSIPA